MGAIPKRDPIKRVAIFVELESGITVALFAQPDPHENDAELVINMDRPTQRVDWAKPGDAVRVPLAPMDISVHLDGLHEYKYTEAMPAMVRATLSVIAAAVTL